MKSGNSGSVKRVSRKAPPKLDLKRVTRLCEWSPTGKEIIVGCKSALYVFKEKRQDIDSFMQDFSS